MPRAFTAATDTVNVGSAASLDNLLTPTYLAVLYPTSSLTSGGIFAKGTAAGGNRRSFELRTSVVSNGLFGIVDCGTTDAVAEGNVIIPDVWQVVGMQFNDATKVIRLFHGTLNTPFEEVAYSSQVTGSGAAGNNAANDQFIGSYGAGTSGGAGKRFAPSAIYNRLLDIEEMRAWWRVAQDLASGVGLHELGFSNVHHVGGCVGFWSMGASGHALERDWSGSQNHGTVTGTQLLPAVFPNRRGRRVLYRPPQLATQTLAGAVTPAGATLKQTSRSLTGTLTGAATLLKQTVRALSGTLTTAGALTAVKTALVALAATLSPAGTLARRTDRLLTGALTSAAALVRRVDRPLTGTLTTGGTLLKRTARALTAALTPAGALTAVKTALLSLTGTLSSAGAVALQTRKSLGATLSNAGALVKQTRRALVGTVAPSATVVRHVARALAAALALGGTVSRLTARTLAAAMAVAGTCVRQAQKGVSGALAFSGTITRRVSRALTGLLAFVGGLSSTGGSVPSTPETIRVATVRSLSPLRTVASMAVPRHVVSLSLARTVQGIS